MAEQIPFISMSHFTVGSASDFHSNVCKLIDETTPAALHIEDLYPAYQSTVETLASLVNRRTALISTKALKGTDQERDRGCGVIVNVVSTYMTSLVATKREAAELLGPQLAPYKGIGRHEYSKQTAEVKGLLAVLNDEANAAAVEALSLADDVAALADANARFEALFAQKAAEMTDRAAENALDSTEVIQDASARYAEITQRVNAYAIVSPTEAINNFIRKLGGYIAVYADIAGGSTKPTDAPDPSEPTDPDTDGGDDGGTPGEI